MLRATAETALRKAIQSSQNAEQAACLKAELAAYLARMGDFDQAESIVREVRASPTWKSSKLSVLLMLAEALIALRNEHNFNALDRLSRGFVLAIAFRELEIAALAAAWLAQFNYNRLARLELKHWVDKCIELKPNMSAAGRTRFCLTQGSIASYIGDTAAANNWYQQARQLAVGLQDEAFIAAAMYNRSALGISRVRVDQVRGTAFRGDVELLGIEIDSALAYSHVTGNTAATSMQKLWKGRLLMVANEFASALPLIEQAIGNMPEIVEPHLRDLVDADIATCQLRTGGTEEALRVFRSLPKEARPALHVDDCIVYYAQLSDLARVAGDADHERLCWHRDRCIEEYSSVIDELRACLAPASPLWT